MPTSPTQFSASLTDKQQLNEAYLHLFFELTKPHRLSFQAGQYVSLEVSEDGDRRSYSVCHDPSKEHGFELLVDVSPKGAGSVFLESLSLGQTVKGLGPVGRFVLEPELPAVPHYFVATGSGIAPFRSMIMELLHAKQFDQPIELWWGMRYQQQLFWLDDLEDWVSSYNQFSSRVILSRPPAEWTLDSGRVTDLVTATELPPNGLFYLCGGSEMIEDVTKLLLAKNINQDQINWEKFF